MLLIVPPGYYSPKEDDQALSWGTPIATNVLLLSVLRPSPHCELPIEHMVRIQKELRKLQVIGKSLEFTGYFMNISARIVPYHLP